MESSPRRPHDPPWRSRDAVREIPYDVAAMLRATRKARGLTLKGAAEAAGVSWRMLAHLEHGDRAPSHHTAERITAVYQLDVDDAARLHSTARRAGYSSPYRTGEHMPAP